jgi:sugar/nucleoside kinase (ribokinase family)
VGCVFLGRSTVDLVYQVASFPEENTKTTANYFLAQAGGPALNAAITFSFLGGAAHLVSAVGRGAWSNVVKTELERYGVRLTDFCATEDFSPPVSSIVINANTGSRTIFNAPARIPEGFPVLPPFEEIRSRLLLCDGFYMAEAGSMIRAFAAGGGTICLDGGTWREETAALLPLVCVAICSERFRPPGIASDEGVIEYLADRGVEYAAITRGESEIIASDRGRKFTVPVEKVPVVDTLGAGDILHGAFCWYFLRGCDFQEALRTAAKVATRSVEFFGAREWMAHFPVESR